MNPKNAGLSLGFVWALTWFLGTWLSIITGFPREILELYGSLHPGYSITPAGSLVAFAYSFVFGFVFAWLAANVYNHLEKSI